MSNANTNVDSIIPPQRRLTSHPKPPIALRPLHRIWRQTIDGLEIVPVTLPVRNLPPACEGLITCQISDFHVDRDEDLRRLEHAVEVINLQQPELVFLTGDYFSGPETMRRYLDGFRRALAQLRPAHGVFAVAGNHDHWSSFGMIKEALLAAGVNVLANQNHRVAFNGAELVIVGIDDLWSRRAEPSRAFRGVQPGDCAIVLAHNPDTALYARPLGPGVMLSGHTHGGVVRIPYYGSPIKSILRIGKRFYAGLNRYGEFYIYTNRGLGTFWLRIRINCRPEISRFVLTRLEDAEVVRARGRGTAAMARKAKFNACLASLRAFKRDEIRRLRGLGRTAPDELS
ncbi:MAG: metallophosphoesterase, partial [Candidatus Binataceae bacterium]